MLIVDRVKTMCIPKEKLRVGDKVTFKFKDGQKRTVTAHKIIGDDALFIFDECVASRPIAEREELLSIRSNMPVNFENSDLYKWLQSEFRPLFPDSISNLVHGLSIPSYGMIFGNEEQVRRLTEDHDSQLELMRSRKNRLSFMNNCVSWYWLSNQYVKEGKNDYRFITNDFVHVTDIGSYALSSGFITRGVRPIFYMQIK